jgi:Rrf2 family protein
MWLAEARDGASRSGFSRSGDVVQLTRAADYGVRVMIHLASLGQEARVSLSALAEAAEAPPAFLAKVLQQMVHAGLVVSHRGKRGGFSLAPFDRSPSLLEIIDELDGLPPLNDCLKPSGGCERRSWCGAHVVWLDAQSRMREVLAGASLESMVRMTAMRRSVAGMK